MTNTTTSPATDSPASGKRVFISYRTQEPDIRLAQAFHDHLKAAGHEPFMAAKSITWGENWVDRIDRELKSCDYFLLLLSEQSATSDMVAGEVRTAKRLQDESGKPVILPIRLNLSFDDPLNYELRSILQTIQQASWNSPDDTPILLQGILDLIAVEGAPKTVDPPEPKPYPNNRPPLPVADLELPGGTMPLDSKFYIKREPWDSRCVQEIENRAGLVRIAIAHSTESYVVLDTNSSPFNVGLAVDLLEFTPEQVLELANKHRLNWERNKVTALMAMVGGHPYLVRQALYRIAQQDLTLEKLLAEAPTDGGIYGEHLRRHLWNLQQHPDLTSAFKQVLGSESPVILEPMLAFKLNGMGLVNLQGNDVVLRHEPLYRPYFRSRLKIKS